jgi:hypothetical protein
MLQPLEATQREELGPLVGEHHQPGTVVWLFRKGLFVEHRRTRFAGGFDDIRGVYVEDRTKESPELRLKLPGRLSVKLKGGDEKADQMLRGLLRMATPALLKRCVSEYDRGEVVDFGAVRLCKDYVAVRRFLHWKKLPVAKLTGWMARDGWLFLDKGEGRPEPFAEVRLRRIANLEVLTALLRKACGAGDLAQPANALRHSARGKTWLSRPTTALTRKPRTAGKAAARYGLYASAIAAGGLLGMRYDLIALAQPYLHSAGSLFEWAKAIWLP